jgi:hypothetical protein
LEAIPGGVEVSILATAIRLGGGDEASLLPSRIETLPTLVLAEILKFIEKPADRGDAPAEGIVGEHLDHPLLVLAHPLLPGSANRLKDKIVPVAKVGDLDRPAHRRPFPGASDASARAEEPPPSPGAGSSPVSAKFSMASRTRELTLRPSARPRAFSSWASETLTQVWTIVWGSEDATANSKTSSVLRYVRRWFDGCPFPKAGVTYER